MDHLLEPEFDEKLIECPICASDRLVLHDTDFNGRTISKCSECGIMFLNPQYSDRYLSEFYGRYTSVDDCGAQSAPLDSEPERYLVHGHYFDLIESRVGSVENRPKHGLGQQTEKGRFLSVGCGDGFELRMALERGWEAEGFEVDPEITAAISSALGVPVRGGDFYSIDYPPDYFDCVYLHQVLEHPKNPRDYLSKIREILRPGGVVFIAVPNISSTSNVVKTLAGRLHLKKRRGRHYDTWHHLFYYSPGALKRILEHRYGFRVVELRNGFGHKARARHFSEGRIMREIWLNRFLPCRKDVFIAIAMKSGSA